MLHKSLMKPLLVLSFAGVLAGCNKNPFEVTQSNCPATSVVAGTGSLTHFKGEGRTADDVLYEATISHIKSVCEQSDDAIRHSVDFSVVVERGPAMPEGGMEVQLPYFVALMRDNNMITNKKLFDVNVRFAGDDRVRASRESVVQGFGDLDIARRYDYELLVGFQLSGADLAHNVLR